MTLDRRGTFAIGITGSATGDTSKNVAMFFSAASCGTPFTDGTMTLLRQ